MTALIKIVFSILLFWIDASRAASQCQEVTALAAMEDGSTIAQTDLDTLEGTWISEGCETRPGPEYVLRYYTFDKIGRYVVTQHYYWDDSCSSPQLTIQSYGKIQLRNSMVQPGAAAGTIRTVNVTVTPQDDRATRELDRTVSLECPGQTWKAWRKYEEYTVYDQRYDENKKSFKLWMSAHKNTQYSINSKGSNVQISDISCLGSLKWAFNELKLVKILLRPFMEQFRKVSREVKMELLLGDIHSNEKMRQYYKPTSFQAPLVKQLKEPTQIFINRHTYVVKSSQAIPQNLFSNSKTPIHLNEKPHLPAYIWGQWASTRCESRPGGTLYLTRKFFFYPEDASWVGEHNFYSDPFCRIRKFVVTAAGSLLLQQSNDKLKGARNIDFKIKRATMTVQDAKMILDMQLEGHCGVGDWKVNVPKDLSITGGCYRLGIVLPSMQYDVVKVEMDFKGAWLLFLGQVDTDNIQQNDVSRRPTAYQLPLVKCGEIPNYTEDLWEILNDQTYGYSSGHRTEFQWTLYLYFLIWTISILH